MGAIGAIAETVLADSALLTAALDPLIPFPVPLLPCLLCLCVSVPLLVLVPRSCRYADCCCCCWSQRGVLLSRNETKGREATARADGTGEAALPESSTLGATRGAGGMSATDLDDARGRGRDLRLGLAAGAAAGTGAGARVETAAAGRATQECYAQDERCQQTDTCHEGRHHIYVRAHA